MVDAICLLIPMAARFLHFHHPSSTLMTCQGYGEVYCLRTHCTWRCRDLPEEAPRPELSIMRLSLATQLCSRRIDAAVTLSSTVMLQIRINLSGVVSRTP